MDVIKMFKPRNLYNNDEYGYVNMKYIMDNCPRTFLWLIGARGIGKTYGAVDYSIERNIPAIFMRRTQQQCDTISTYEMCQAKPNFNDRNMDYAVQSISKGITGIYTEFDEDGKPCGIPLFVNCALSTVYNIRGFDASDYDILWYDECIPESHARPIKNEGEALLNAYETINRNRELKGKPPVKFVGMSNSNRLDNALFAELNMITACDKQFSKGYSVYDNPDRDMMVINFQNSPVSEKKSETALYKFAKGMSYGDMALKNEFRDYKSKSKSFNIKDLTPMANIGELTFYRLKSCDSFYISAFYMQAPLRYSNDEKGLQRFQMSDLCRTLILLYMADEIYFENYNCEYLMKFYCGKAK